MDIQLSKMYAVTKAACHWAYAPAIHAASHVDHEKRVAWFSFSMLACGSVSIIMVLHLAAPWVARVPL